MGYSIESRPCSKAGWFTPAESNNFYAARYARNGITWHWWGDGTGASNHDNIVNYLNGKGSRGEAPTVNYVLSDNKITECVSPDNVAWASGPGNPTTISVELQPTLGTEGYKKAGWLTWQLEARFGHRMTFYPHNYWMTTACPGTISLDRIRQEADKWARGEYDPVPTPTPPPATANIQWVKLDKPQEYVTNKAPTKLWNFNQTTWGGFGNGVKDYAGGEKVVIYGKGINHTLNATYLVTEYSFTKGITNGFNEKDMSLVLQPAPQPDPIPAPIPPTPTKPEWELNLRDIDDTKMWLTKEQDLINIATGQPATPAKVFVKNDEFVASALTVVGGTEYRITDYSFKKGIFNGVPTTSLTLTVPGVPDVPPVPEVPTEPSIPISALKAFWAAVTALWNAMIDKFSKK